MGFTMNHIRNQIIDPIMSARLLTIDKEIATLNSAIAHLTDAINDVNLAHCRDEFLVLIEKYKILIADFRHEAVNVSSHILTE